MKAERVVCDTNVLISAAIMPDSKARQVLDHVVHTATLLICDAMIDELATRLARPKFDRYVSDTDRDEFMQLVTLLSERVAITARSHGVRDPDDDKIIETAIAGGADCLVTGDKYLLALRPAGENGKAESVAAAQFQGVAILKPAEYLDLTAPQA